MTTIRTTYDSRCSHAAAAENGSETHKAIFLFHIFSSISVELFQSINCAHTRTRERRKNTQKLFFIISSESCTQLDESHPQIHPAHTSSLSFIQWARQSFRLTPSCAHTCIREFPTRKQPSDSLPAHDPNCGFFIDFSTVLLWFYFVLSFVVRRAEEKLLRNFLVLFNFPQLFSFFPRNEQKELFSPEIIWSIVIFPLSPSLVSFLAQCLFMNGAERRCWVGKFECKIRSLFRATRKNMFADCNFFAVCGSKKWTSSPDDTIGANLYSIDSFNERADFSHFHLSFACFSDAKLLSCVFED